MNGATRTRNAAKPPPSYAYTRTVNTASAVDTARRIYPHAVAATTPLYTSFRCHEHRSPMSFSALSPPHAHTHTTHTHCFSLPLLQPPPPPPTPPRSSLPNAIIGSPSTTPPGAYRPVQPSRAISLYMRVHVLVYNIYHIEYCIARCTAAAAQTDETRDGGTW
ncbi:unnamed protein product [Aphis gossypii]|uniref:Uncharacterized protein n=1 Tax=Aphis gossypii TaxID=80765 RepID=A0A9P0IWR0_APHGO|nr:unnamed protein product [Aphis gossypii]